MTFFLKNIKSFLLGDKNTKHPLIKGIFRLSFPMIISKVINVALIAILGIYLITLSLWYDQWIYQNN